MKNRILVSLLVLIACSSCSEIELRESHGESVEKNSQAQTLNPDAGKAEASHSLDGQKAELVMKRYRTEKSASQSQNLISEITED